MHRTVYFIIFLFIFSSVVFAGTTGKIAGRVVDANTGEPLVGANILVKDSFLGASTDLDGYYAILNVPPGSYTVEATYIGYNTKVISDVKINIDGSIKADTARSFKFKDFSARNVRDLNYDAKKETISFSSAKNVKADEFYFDILGESKFYYDDGKLIQLVDVQELGLYHVHSNMSEEVFKSLYDSYMDQGDFDENCEKHGIERVFVDYVNL